VVRYAREHGVKPAASMFNTTPKTVRKWLKRWEPGSMRGLEDQSKAPKTPKVYISEQQRQEVIKLKKMLPSFGAERIKRNFGLKISEKTIRRIWRQAGLLKTKRRKHKTKQDLRTVKSQWKLFEQTSMDTKDLDDIPELWPQIRTLRLPKVQYTAREVVSGLQFIAYADERSLNYATLFAEMIIQHLIQCGVNLKDCRIQTDNGSEFIGAWNAKEDSIFTKTVTQYEGLRHTTIPPGAHTWQSDVETVHRIIEDELYEVESFTDRQDFLKKTTLYNLWFNIARKNTYKGNKTPWEIIRSKNPNLDPELPMLTPVFLDKLFFQRTKNIITGEYHVVPDPCDYLQNNSEYFRMFLS
jgi:transposase